MRLPVPNQREVEEFRELYRCEFGVEISSPEAQELATRIIQLFYIKHYAIHPLCPEEQ